VPEVALADRPEQLLRVLPLERLLAGDELVERDAERPDVGPRVGHVAVQDLGGEVGGAPHQHADLGEIGRGLVLGDPKSMSFTSPSRESITFAGFTSRWSSLLKWT